MCKNEVSCIFRIVLMLDRKVINTVDDFSNEKYFSVFFKHLIFLLTFIVILSLSLTKLSWWLKNIDKNEKCVKFIHFLVLARFTRKTVEIFLFIKISFS